MIRTNFANLRISLSDMKLSITSRTFVIKKTFRLFTIILGTVASSTWCKRRRKQNAAEQLESTCDLHAAQLRQQQPHLISSYANYCHPCPNNHRSSSSINCLHPVALVFLQPLVLYPLCTAIDTLRSRTAVSECSSKSSVYVKKEPPDQNAAA